MLKIDPKNIPLSELHGYLLSSIAPRPIALASTINNEGLSNLSPFSFFNAFSANPPICIFSPARRIRDNTSKHTLENCKSTKEVVINIVNYGLVQQSSLASTEYNEGINEFIKSGLTEEPSDIVKPFRVKESPVQMECKVKEIISLGEEGGAGNLVICEILLIHINRNILDQNNKIDPTKIDLVGRLGENWYTRTHQDSIFEVEKPIKNKGVGVDSIPAGIKNSYILSGNDLGKLGNIEAIPLDEEIEIYKQNNEIQQILIHGVDDNEQREMLHKRAKELLAKNKIKEAWITLLVDKLNRI